MAELYRGVDLAAEIGVHAATIKQWSLLGIITPDATLGSTRIYGAADRERVLALGALKSSGISMQQISRGLTSEEAFDELRKRVLELQAATTAAVSAIETLRPIVGAIRPADQTQQAAE